MSKNPIFDESILYLTNEKIIEEIDGIFDYVMKSSKWERLADKLKEIFSYTFSSMQKKAVGEVIDYINTSEEGNISDDEINFILSLLERKLGNDYYTAVISQVVDTQSKAYKEGQKEIIGKFEFNKTDHEAISWLAKDQSYWIQENYNNNLSEKISKTLKKVIEDGMDRNQAGMWLKSELGDVSLQHSSYWEGLSNHIVTRSREFGRVEGYVKAKITHARIVAVMDSRTSKICAHMHNRIIPVTHLIEQRDKLMSARDPERVKKIAPWLTDKEVEVKVKGKKTKDLPKGIGLPPYHWNCRTLTVGVDEEEAEQLAEKS